MLYIFNTAKIAELLWTLYTICNVFKPSYKENEEKWTWQSNPGRISDTLKKAWEIKQ